MENNINGEWWLKMSVKQKILIWATTASMIEQFNIHNIQILPNTFYYANKSIIFLEIFIIRDITQL